MTKKPLPLRKKTPSALPKKTPVAAKVAGSKKPAAKAVRTAAGKKSATKRPSGKASVVKKSVARERVSKKPAPKSAVREPAPERSTPAAPRPTRKLAVSKAAASAAASTGSQRLHGLVSSAASASTPVAPPVKRVRTAQKPDLAAADALFLAHAAAVGLSESTVDQAWARMPLFGPLLALALVRQGVDRLVLAVIRVAALEVPDAELGDALAALSAPSSRAALIVAEARDEAIFSRVPARAALLDAVHHALEGALARDEGDAVEAYARGIETARSLTAALASAHGRDASDQAVRSEIVRGLLERLRAVSPTLPPVA